MTKKKGEQDYEAAARIAKLKQIDNRGGDMVQASKEFYDDLNKRLDSKGVFSDVNVNLFGEKVPEVYFIAATTKDDNGFMMCSCGTSISDDQNYVVTTHHLKADEVPELCNDAKTFAELVAKLLNEYYNKK